MLECLAKPSSTSVYNFNKIIIPVPRDGDMLSSHIFHLTFKIKSDLLQASRESTFRAISEKDHWRVTALPSATEDGGY